MFERIRERLSKATLGVWHWHGDRPFARSEHGDIHLDGFLGNRWNQGDKDLIAHGSTDIKILLEALDIAVEALEEIKRAALNGDETSTELNCHHLSEDALAKISELEKGCDGWSNET